MCKWYSTQKLKLNKELDLTKCVPCPCFRCCWSHSPKLELVTTTTAMTASLIRLDIHSINILIYCSTMSLH